jgi:thiol-disulfide isomerase/thioredoxin
MMRSLLPLAVLVSLLSLPAGCNNDPKPSSDNSTTAPSAKSRLGDSPLLGKNAPEFNLPTLTGGTAGNADLKGHVTIMDFWATWCEPCRRSMPHLQQLAANPELSGKGLRVLAVNATNQDERADVEAYIKENGFTFPVALDENGMMTQAFQVRGFPTTFVVGRDGTVRNVFVGVTPDTAKALDEAVTAALKG